MQLTQRVSVIKNRLPADMGSLVGSFSGPTMTPERLLALSVVAQALRDAISANYPENSKKLKSVFRWLRHPDTADTWITLAYIPIARLYEIVRAIAESRGISEWYAEYEQSCRQETR